MLGAARSLHVEKLMESSGQQAKLDNPKYVD
jgi:hypothetical protein